MWNSLRDASEELIRGAFVNKTADDAAYSVHRLIQSVITRRIPAPEHTEFLGTVVHLLSWGFPDHRSTDIGHQVSAWAWCEKCLSRIHSLMEVSKRNAI